MKRAQVQDMWPELEHTDDTRVFEKTAVFHVGDLHRENPAAGHEMDDETRELPLISGRFAGREWKVEELRREEQEKTARRATRLNRARFRAWGVALAGAAMSFVLLTASLTCQAALTGRNDQAVAAAEEIHALREENDRLRAETAQLPDAAHTGEYAAVTLGTQPVAREQAAGQAEDCATVLAVRRGQGFNHFCNEMIDTLGAYLHA